MSTYSEFQYRQLDAAVKTTGSLSLLGSLIVVVVFLRSDKSSRMNYSRQCILMVALFEIIGSAGRIMGPFTSGNRGLCKAQGALIIIEVSASLWVMAHTTNVLLRVFFKWSAAKADKMKYFFHFVGIVLPLVGSIVAVSANVIAPAGRILN